MGGDSSKEEQTKTLLEIVDNKQSPADKLDPDHVKKNPAIQQFGWNRLAYWTAKKNCTVVTASDFKILERIKERFGPHCTVQDVIKLLKDFDELQNTVEVQNDQMKLIVNSLLDRLEKYDQALTESTKTLKIVTEKYGINLQKYDTTLKLIDEQGISTEALKAAVEEKECPICKNNLQMCPHTGSQQHAARCCVLPFQCRHPLCHTCASEPRVRECPLCRNTQRRVQK